MAAHATTGDGVLTALQLAARVAATGEPIAELAGVVRRLPQTLVNVPGVDKGRADADEPLLDAVRRAESGLGDTGPGAAALVGHRGPGARHGRGRHAGGGRPGGARAGRRRPGPAGAVSCRTPDREWDQALRDMALWIIESGTRSPRASRRSSRRGTRAAGRRDAVRRASCPTRSSRRCSTSCTARCGPRRASGWRRRSSACRSRSRCSRTRAPTSDEHARGARARAAAVPRAGEPARTRRWATSGSSFYEGCLSVVGYQAVVARARQVHLTGTDERGRRGRRARDRLVRADRPARDRPPRAARCTWTAPSCARSRRPTSSVRAGPPSRRPAAASPRARVPAGLRAPAGWTPGSDPGMIRGCTRDEPGVTPMSSERAGDLPWRHDTGRTPTPVHDAGGDVR